MSTVEVVRGGCVESRHRVRLAGCDALGRLLASIGDPDSVTIHRSVAEPIQAGEIRAAFEVALPASVGR